MAISKPAARTHYWAQGAASGAGGIEDPGDSYVDVGWTVSVTPPPLEYFNWLQQYNMQGVRYMLTQGLPAYDAAETYSINSIVISDDGAIRASLVNSNTGNTPSTSPSDWGSPTVPTPTAGDNSTKVATTAFVNTTITNDSSTAAVANTLAKRDGSANLTAAGFNVSSDARLKDQISPVVGALERLDLYRGVTFRRRESKQRYAGVIAQEFSKARPEAIRKDRSGFLEVDVMGVVAELIEALREERDTRKALEQRIAALEGAGR